MTITSRLLKWIFVKKTTLSGRRFGDSPPEVLGLSGFNGITTPISWDITWYNPHSYGEIYLCGFFSWTSHEPWSLMLKEACCKIWDAESMGLWCDRRSMQIPPVIGEIAVAAMFESLLFVAPNNGQPYNQFTNQCRECLWFSNHLGIWAESPRCVWHHFGHSDSRTPGLWLPGLLIPRLGSPSAPGTANGTPRCFEKRPSSRTIS